MIERYIYTALQAGIEIITARPAILDALFKDDYELDAAEVAAIKQLWEEKPPNVIHSYPRIDSSFPLYAVILSEEREDQTFIGNDAGMVTDPNDPNYGADIDAAVWVHSYWIQCLAEHPDVTRYYYEVAKSILLATDWEERGIFSIQMSGADLAPDPRYLPENLFMRQITFKCNREFQRLDLESRFHRGTQIAGIHVDKSGSPSDVGEVKTLVTPYTEEDDDAT